MAPVSLLTGPRDLGPRPLGGPQLIAAIERSGLRGRGGAAFPVAAKWASVAGRRQGDAVVLANGAEGEPLSGKDRTLMELRPDLVLDGALLARESVGARAIVLYVGERHRAAAASLERALARRPADERRWFSLLRAPARYVAGEESAAVHFVNEGVASPTDTPPRPFERGVGGRPTLVQNVETLTHVAVIARGLAPHPTTLLTIGGWVARPGVVEVLAGTSVREALTLAGGPTGPFRALLLGGYFGAWVHTADALDLPLDAATLCESGRSLGCGVLWVLPASASPVVETARIMHYLASESSAQCGPCFFGLRSLSDACARLASGRSDGSDLERLRRWAAMVAGRGACRHPDGAAGFLQSALEVFACEFEAAARARLAA